MSNITSDLELSFIVTKMSTTNVVSVKVNDIRPKYQDLEDWMNDPSNVYIARRGVVFIQRNGKKYRYPHIYSIWANPYKIGVLSREQVIDMYRSYIITKLQSGEITYDQLKQLKGKKLGCWCKTKGNENTTCHGDVLIELLKSF